ncbi:MAG: ABC transporter ATP-binding protein [Myxococcota bacterium]
MSDYPAIRARHLYHRYDEHSVLHDVTFDVGRGEIFGFIGPNGAGKTTTIRIMSTLLEPSAGRVEIDGIDVTMRPDQVRRIIGYMPDHAGVYDRVTVREYLEFFTAAYGVASPAVVDAVIELTDIGRLQDALVATLSKGQKQRLQLARILLHDPQVLILDEPASDLDPRARIEIRNLLLDLKNLGKTILLSSHILSELSDVCTSVGIIERGRMVVSGPIGEIGDRLAAVRAAPEAASPVTQEAFLRTVRVRLIGDLDAAADRLVETPFVLEVELVGAALSVSYGGGDERVAEMVALLVGEGFGVVGVEQEQNQLERIFLEATRGRSTPSETP